MYAHSELSCGLDVVYKYLKVKYGRFCCQRGRQGEPAITRESESTLAKSTSHIASHCRACHAHKLISVEVIAYLCSSMDRTSLKLISAIDTVL